MTDADDLPLPVGVAVAYLDAVIAGPDGKISAEDVKRDMARQLEVLYRDTHDCDYWLQSLLCQGSPTSPQPAPGSI